MQEMIPEFAGVWRELAEMEQEPWVAALKDKVSAQYSGEGHGDLPRWQKALTDLATFEGSGYSVTEGQLTFDVKGTQDGLRENLLALSPWRKGPFQFGEVFVDTEWRSDWKWERLRDKDFFAGRPKRILDVGCGNGYHLWRMLDEGARFALGIDPAMLFGCQFLAARHFAEGAVNC